MEYIFKISFYDTRRCKTSHTDMYYLKPEHTQWAFNSYQITTVFYIKVSINSTEYKSAVKNSMLIETKTNSKSETETETDTCYNCDTNLEVTK